MKIHTVYQAYRKKPFVARWYENGRMRNRFFSCEEARETFIREFSHAAGRQDLTLPTIEPHKLIRWQQAAQLAPEADPVEVFRFWLKTREKERRQSNKNLSTATGEYLAAMQRMKRHPSYITHVEKALNDLRDEVGDTEVRNVTVAMLRSHLFALPYSPVTLRHRRTYLMSAFKWWIKQGWADDNPVRNIECPEVVDKEPGILTVEQTIQLFRANEKADPGICGILALGAFAGMRSSAIVRLERNELDFKNRAILTPASKTKKGRRHYIEDLPDNLWPWLERTPEGAFKMTPRQYALRRQKAFERAGLLVTKAQAKKAGAKPKAPPEKLPAPLIRQLPRRPPP